MNASANLDIICNRIANVYRKVYGDAVEAIFLYGSYARGDFNEDSDIDFAAIVDGERIHLQEKLKQVWHETSDIDLEYDVLTSPTVIPTAEFNKYVKHLPYYRNIRQEGKRLE